MKIFGDRDSPVLDISYRSSPPSSTVTESSGAKASLSYCISSCEVALGFKVRSASCPLLLSFGDKFAVLAFGVYGIASPIVVDCRIYRLVLSAILDIGCRR